MKTIAIVSQKGGGWENHHRSSFGDGRNLFRPTVHFSPCNRCEQARRHARPGESYSDVILRLVEIEAKGDLR